MPITTKKPTGGKLVLGRDHKLDCVLTWNDETHPNTDTEVDVFYATIKSSDALDDEDAAVALNSTDNADQFIISGAGITPADGEFTFWLKAADQAEIVADTQRYIFDIVIVLTDGTAWPFVMDYNLLFTQPATLEIT
jgi:hypothetical protein